jgi:hypothetical protein
MKTKKRNEINKITRLTSVFIVVSTSSEAAYRRRRILSYFFGTQCKATIREPIPDDRG